MEKTQLFRQGRRLNEVLTTASKSLLDILGLHIKTTGMCVVPFFACKDQHSGHSKHKIKTKNNKLTFFIEKYV